MTKKQTNCTLHMGFKPGLRGLLLLLCLFSSGLAVARQRTVQIRGRVTTSDGHAAPSVSVSLSAKGFGATTDETGNFIIKGLKPGTYLLKVSAIGLQSQQKQITIGSSDLSGLDFSLIEDLNSLTEVAISANYKKYKADKPSSSLRLDQPLLTIPQNIQIITGTVLKDQQVFDMMESITRNVSGTQRVGHWDMYANITMRGSQVKPFRNGMNTYISPWSPLSEDMSMVDHIEFVKGPAGFMISNGEPGGLYNIVTKKPSGENRREIGLVLGDYNTYRSTADLDGRISKNGKWLYRLNVMGQLKNAHRDYEYNNRWSLVPVLKYQMDDQSSVVLEYTRQYAQMNVIGGNYAFSKRGYGDLPREFTTAQPNFDPTVIHDQSLQGTFEHQFNADWKLIASALYGHFKQRGQSMWPSGFSATDDRLLQRAINNWDALSANKTAQIFLNGTIATSNINHRILAGLDTKYSSYYADWSQWTELGAPLNIYEPEYSGVTLPGYDRSQDIRQRGVQYNYGYQAIYLQDELGMFNNTLRLTLAGRITKNITDNPYEDSTRDTRFTPRVGLNYAFSNSTSAYFMYDQFFLQNPGTDWQDKAFDPLSGRNLELGLKRDWLGGKWNSVVSAYWIKKQNVLVQDLDHPFPGGGFFSRQAGEQDIKGLELDLRGEIAKGLALVLNYAYTNGKISKDADATVVGNRVPGTARHNQNTWLNYKILEGTFRGLNFSGGYQYQIKRVAGLVFDKNVYPLPDYFRLDAGLGYTNNRFSVNMTVNNLSNRYLFTGGVSGTDYWWQTEPGRNFRLGMNYQF